MSKSYLRSTRPLLQPVRYCTLTPLQPARTFTRALSTTQAKMSDQIEKISTKTGPPPAAPYSQGIKAAGQIWVSGQLPADSTGKLIEGSITEKTRACCQNVKAILEAGGSGIEKVVKVNVFLTDMDNFKEMNEEYAKHFAHKPARSCVAVHQLPFGVPVEIEVVALQ